MFKLRNYIISQKFLLFLNSMVATCLRTVGSGQQKAGKLSGTTRKQLEKHFVTNQVNWQQVSNMIRYKRSIRGAASQKSWWFEVQ